MTRSKVEKEDQKQNHNQNETMDLEEDYEDLDDEGNLKDLVVKDKPRKHGELKAGKTNRAMNDMLMSYLIMKATDKANEELQKRRKRGNTRQRIKSSKSSKKKQKEDSQIKEIL